MGLNPGVDFTNMFHTVFTWADPNSAKRQSSCQCLFLLCRAACIKAVTKTLIKSTLGDNFTNDLRTAFMLVDPESVKNTVKSSVCFYAFGICGSKSCT